MTAVRTGPDLGDLGTVLDSFLADADAELATRYPGDRAVRQPVHTVYVPADRYDGDTVAGWGRAALDLLDEHGGSDAELADLLDVEASLAADVRRLVRAKLATEPVEDLRVDFEDGYGSRSDEEEDAAVLAAAAHLARTVRAGTATPFFGVRIKSFEAATRRRGLRTLIRCVAELDALGGLAPGFRVTFPKVTSVAQVEALVLTCERLEQVHALEAGRLSFEIQVETPQSILAADGTVLVSRLIGAAQGRCSALHYGTYDYSASVGVAARYQSMEHPAADHAKAVLQVAAAGTGVQVSDGSTNVLPTGDRTAVRAGWRNHARLVRRSLERGFYQGWDLHPGHLPSRFLATYAFYREGLPEATTRLRAYLGRADSGFLDEPATAAALAGFLLRAVECGAVRDDEIADHVGIDRGLLAELARRPAGAQETS
jgi:citrate lyase beta subunit